MGVVSYRGGPADHLPLASLSFSLPLDALTEWVANCLQGLPGVRIPLSA